MSQNSTPRREVLRKMVPYLIRAYFEASSALSPAGILTEALKRYDGKLEGEEIPKQRETVKQMLRDIQDLDITSEGEDKLSLRLSIDRVLEYVKDYVREAFLHEGAFDARYTSLSGAPSERDGPEFDGMLALPYRTVYTKLLNEDPSPEVVTRWLEVAKRLIPSELWVFTSRDSSSELDLRLEPVFINENKVLFGRLKLVSLSTLFYEILGKKFKVTIDQQHKATDSIRLVLEKKENLPPAIRTKD